MVRINNSRSRPLDVRMTREIGADKLSVPGPVILRVGCGVDTNESTALPDESFERGLLIGIENVTGRVQKHGHSIPRQIFISENGRIFACVNDESMLASERTNRGNSPRDRVMAKA